MGFFGTYAYENGSWSVLAEGALPPLTEPWLWIDIHDSDITSVVYAPPGPGTGVAYLGMTPRTYFENPGASDPTDVSREAAGLAAWASSEVSAEEIRGFLAEDEDPDSFEWDEEEDVDAIDDGEVFVEVKTARFLTAMGLPVPYQLS